MPGWRRSASTAAPSAICATCAATRSSIIVEMSSPLAIALGDPAGVGPEIVAKSWERRDAVDLPPFFAVGDCDAIEAVWKGPVRAISDPGEALEVFAHALPVVRVGGGHAITPGSPDF